jgi:titin
LNYLKNYTIKLISILIYSCLILSCVSSVSANVTIPGPPTNLTATFIGNHNYELDWDAPDNDGGSSITGYRIEIAPYNTYGAESEHWELLVEIWDTITNYTHEQSAANIYCYRVFAVNNEGVSVPSNYANSVISGAEVPSVISGLDFTVVTNTRIDISWEEPNDNGLQIIGYKIDYRINDVQYVLVESTETTDTNYSHNDLTPGVEYDYKITAINALGVGIMVYWESVTLPSDTLTIPGSPRSLEATPDFGTVDLSWYEPYDDGNSPITGYKIEYMTDEINWTVLVENTESKVTFYTHNIPESCINYYYRVFAINTTFRNIMSIKCYFTFCVFN